MSSLLSWDTVSVITVASLNNSLSEKGNAILNSFQFKSDGGPTQQPYTCEGLLGSWSVGYANATDMLTIYLPITSGTLKSSSAALDISGIVIAIAVSLEFVADQSSTATNLVFSFQSAGKTGDVPSPGVVTPIGMTGPADVLAELGIGGQNELMNDFAQLIVTAAKPMNYFFAQLNTNLGDLPSWLKVFSSGYIYIHEDDGNDFFAILSLVTDSPLPKAQIDTTILPSNGNDTILGISGSLFARYLLMPELVSALSPNLPQADLSFNSSNNQITLINSFGLDSIKVGAIDYYPKVNNMVAYATNGGLYVSISGNCDLKAGISMTYSFECRPSLNPQMVNGSIQFIKDPSPVSSHHADIPWYWEYLSPIASIIIDVVIATISDSLGSKLINGLNSKFDFSMQTSVVWASGLANMNQIVLEDACIMSGKID